MNMGNSYVCGYSLGHENGYTDLIVFKVNASGVKAMGIPLDRNRRNQ
jgi:hypothetical protein